MGQAKARGTREQRIEQSIAKAKAEDAAWELQRSLAREAEIARIAALPEPERSKANSIVRSGRRMGRSNSTLLIAATIAAAMSSGIR